MVKTQGMGSLYKGLSAGLLRQATYTTARLGIYNNIFEAAKVYNDNKVGGWVGGWVGGCAGGWGPHGGKLPPRGNSRVLAGRRWRRPLGGLLGGACASLLLPGLLPPAHRYSHHTPIQ